ncbi:MAG TPA: hypothetical protein VMF66_02075 [Candidatus Acidoferrum sp.]|nr:hypothetical protein [Candidatus Acidoferrum sp.]
MRKITTRVREMARRNAVQRDAQYQCILAQLSAGITFCIAAEGSDNETRKWANVKNARRTYTKAVDMAGNTELTVTMRRNVEDKTDHLEKLLSQCRPRLSARKSASNEVQ